MMFTSFYAQPSCTPGRAAMQTGRIPNRSGMTTVAFQGQGGGLPAAEWTLASVLKTAGYKTFFTGKWHLGEADYALPNAQGYDEMKYCGLYHLNAYTYADPDWFPDMDPKLREMFQKVTKGALSGNAGEAAREDFKINGQYVNTPDQGVVGIPFFDEYVEKAALDYLDRNGTVRPAVLHERQLHEGAPAEHAGTRSSIHKSLSKIQVRRLRRRERHAHRPHHGQGARARPRQEHLRLLDHRQRRLAGRLSGCRLHAVPRHQGHRPRRRQSRVPSIAWGPGIKAEQQERGDPRRPRLHGDVRRARRRASCRRTIAKGKPIIFDSYDMTPVLFGTGKSPRKSWFYFTENELTPGAARVGNYKAVFNLRGGDGAKTGGLAVDSNLGWKGPEKYVATVPQVFDLWQDPQERYDMFMNNYTEHTWILVTINDAVKELMQTYMKYPPRKLQSESYTGPITLSDYQRFQFVRDQLAKGGIQLPLPTGN